MGRKDFFDNYLSLAYGQLDESWIKDKVEQFEYNYAKYLPKEKNALMLDIGPGHGPMLILWKKLGYENFLAVDISAEVVDFCRDKGLGEIRLITSIQDFLKDKKESFDFISMIEVIEHIKKDDIMEVCTSIKNSLKPSGRVLIETPNIGAISGSLLRYYDFTHETGFTAHSLKQLMETTGFQSIEVKGFEWMYKENLHVKTIKFIRDSFYYFVRKIRMLNASDLTEILLPYIYVTAMKK